MQNSESNFPRVTQRSKILRFILTGIGATLIHLVVAIIAIEVFQILPPAANSLAFTVATCFSYVINTYWSFQTNVTLNNAIKYGVAACLGFSLAYGLSFLAQSLEWHYLVGIFLVICVVPLINFIVHSKWTYK